MLEKMDLNVYGVCYERGKTRAAAIKIMKAKEENKEDVVQ